MMENARAMPFAPDERQDAVAIGVPRIFLAPLLVLLAASCTRPPPGSRGDWGEVAVGYLDRRALAWVNDPPQVGQNYPCAMSCHTTHPFLAARGALGRPSSALATVRAKIEARVTSVTDWKQAVPFYGRRGSALAQRSLATEAVLNAATLALHDAASGPLREVTLRAYEAMWQMQGADGAWEWLKFNLEPWESADDFGAALAALAVGLLPSGEPRTGHEAQVQKLVGYLRRRVAAMALHDKAVLLWAAVRLPELLAPPEREGIATELRSLQREDGGWSIAGWGRGRRAMPNPAATSDGYATALATFVLCRAGHRGDAVARGTAWLRSHQRVDGSWPGRSLNRDRDLNHGFMSDAATAFAALALTSCP
jgi:squalene-hopene/tetraprenyl-beta-curcumene cyclase